MKTSLASFVAVLTLALPLAAAHAESGQPPKVVPPHGDPRHSPVASPNTAPADPNAPVVVLNVVVEADGSISNATVERSSGNAAIDWVAVDRARSWHLVPGTVDGVPVRMQNRIAVRVKPREPQLPEPQPSRDPMAFPVSTGRSKTALLTARGKSISL